MKINFHRKIVTNQTLLWAYILLFVLLGITGFFATKDSQKVISLFKDISDKSIRKLELLGEIKKSNTLLEVTVLRHIIGEDVLNKANLDENFNDEIEKNNTWLAAYERLVSDSTEQTLFNNVIASLKNNIQSRDSLLMLNMKNQDQSSQSIALNYLNTRHYPDFEKYYNAIVQLSDFLTKQTTQKSELSDELVLSAVKRIYCLIIITVLLLAFLGFMVIRTIKKMAKQNKELKEHQEKLKEFEKIIIDYKDAIDQSSVVSIADENGIIKYVNDKFCEESKYNRDELIGQNHRILNSGYHSKEFFKDLWETILIGKVWSGEIRNKAKDGSYFWSSSTIVPFLNKEKKPYQYVAIKNDITERKKAEEELLQLNKAFEKKVAELQASNEELERFAYVASHDLQEPLRMVSSFLNLLVKESEGKLDPAFKEYIDFAVDGSQRMKRLIQDLLQFSRAGSNKEPFTEIDCNEMLSSLRLVFTESLSETGGSLHIKPLPVIKGVQTQLQQVFQNLIGNAIKYHDTRPPEIEVGCNENNGSWQFYVKDNGIGIDPKFFDKLFILFQRLHTKTDYFGTGIGLAICKKIVEKHGGRIWVESEYGKGSTFYFTIKK